jgi:3-deoxy-D-manno-octulosonic-acid transferase
MAIVYNLVLAVLLVVLAPLLLLRVLFSARLRTDFGERLRPLPVSERGTVWVHAASVGEVEAASPLIAALRERGVPLVVTALSLTGRARLRERFPALAPRLAPLDLPLLAGASLRRSRVDLLVLVETELWPNLIFAAASQGTRILIVSGRISDRALPGYRLLRPLFSSLLRRVTRVGARSPEDRQRFVALGAPEPRAMVLGDLKLDGVPTPAIDPALREAIGQGPFLIGGSTHAGEEAALLDAWRELGTAVPGLRLLLVPRHPERAPEVLREASTRGIRAGLRSQGAADCPAVVVDTVGELRSLYTVADLVFAGGTLAPVGGHNLLEPVFAGRMVVAGPHTQNQRVQVELLEPLGVLLRVERADQLAARFTAIWQDPKREDRAARACEALAAHRGALQRSLLAIDRLRRPELG